MQGRAITHVCVSSHPGGTVEGIRGTWDLSRQILERGRTGVGVFAALTATALAVNGAFIYANFVPALLLFLLWTLVTSIVLYRRSPSTQPRVAYWA